MVSTAEILLAEEESREPSSIELARMKHKHDMEKFERQIVEFIKSFSIRKHRRPLVSEIFDNNNDKISTENIHKILQTIHYEEIPDDVSNVDDMENTVDKTSLTSMSMKGSPDNV